MMHNIECTRTKQWYTTATLGLVILSILIFIVINIEIKVVQKTPVL